MVVLGGVALSPGVRKVDVRLPGKGNSNPHGARPVHLIITMIKWIRTSRRGLLFNGRLELVEAGRLRYSSQFENKYFTEMCSGSEAGSYLRLIDLCITQL